MRRMFDRAYYNRVYFGRDIIALGLQAIEVKVDFTIASYFPAISFGRFHLSCLKTVNGSS